MEAPDLDEMDENFRLDSDQWNDEWILEKARVFGRRQFMRIVRKDKKTCFTNTMDKPLIWSYLTKRNSNCYKNFHI